MAGTTVNLLVVEDDAALRVSLSHIFAAFGHRVRCAADGSRPCRNFALTFPTSILSESQYARHVWL